MFTGYIDHLGTVLDVQAHHLGKRLTVCCDLLDRQNGESIAIDGVCTTVVDCSDKQFRCELSPETLACTNLGNLKRGQLVHLERALRLSDRLHGHFVLGHVDQTCQVLDKKPQGACLQYSFCQVKKAARALLVQKGSIAVQGVSLTINTVSQEGFSLMLIPKTLQKTNLGRLRVGDFVNIEYDYLAKLVSFAYKHRNKT